MNDSADRGQTSLTKRLLFVGTISALILILLLTLLVDRSIRNIWQTELDQDLETSAALARAGIPVDPGDFPDWADRTASAGGIRVTLIRVDGVVLADSHQDVSTMENHSDREELREALGGSTGRATRTSATSGIRERYVAMPPQDGLVVRVSTEMRAIEEELARTRSAIVRVAFVVGLVAVAALVYFGRRMARPVTALSEQARAIAGGELKVTPTRHRVTELDQLGLSLASIATDLGGRVEEAEQASSLLEVVLGTIPQGTILFDPSDQVAYSNPSASQILGRIPVALSGLAPFQMQVAVREARESGAIVVKEVDHGIPPRRLRGIATPFAEDRRVLLVVADITEREKMDSIRRDFAANASHELKTPVATIIAASEAMQIALSRGDPSAEHFASRIESSARQLERLVSDLLDLSRLERETPELSPVRLDLVVAEETERVRSRVTDNGLGLSTNLERVTVMASRNDISIAARNLLDNAIRYTPSGGQIGVSVVVVDGTAELRVVDTGEGIPSKDLGRVFERFYRVDTARSRDTGGTGLGLALVKHVAESHGGSVVVESELGRGSTFVLRLPMLNGDDSRSDS